MVILFHTNPLFYSLPCNSPFLQGMKKSRNTGNSHLLVLLLFFVAMHLKGAAGCSSEGVRSAVSQSLSRMSFFLALKMFPELGGGSSHVFAEGAGEVGVVIEAHAGANLIDRQV